MVSEKKIAALFESVRKAAAASRRWPVSVYRLQFNKAFTFRHAAKLVAYLNELGVTDCYASPCFKAKAGSLHGYDVSDHNALNPELGHQKDYQRFVDGLHKRGMGQILDFVPNHMAMFDNPKWYDVLENGPNSIYARFFDIDWAPIKAELRQKVLLPILEDLYGNVLESGQIRLALEQGAFVVLYREHRLPVGPRTAVAVLGPSLDLLQSSMPETDPDLLELQSIVTACRNLPERSETAPDRMAERRREKEIVKRRLADLCARSNPIRTAIGEALKSFNGVVGDSPGFARLHELLEKQAYRLSYWRVASEEINYRRFFDVNELVALRMEDPIIFEETHRLVRDLLSNGAVTGLRIDHVDGLFDPCAYLWRLQEARWLDIGMELAKRHRRLSQADHAALRHGLQAIIESQRQAAPDSRDVGPLFIVVEKVLGEKETIRKSWPVDGTTGYEFAVALNQIFVSARHRRSLLDTYRWFTRSNESFQDVAYRSKKLVMDTSMAAEVNVLAHRLNVVSERSWQYRDITLNSLRDAIREVIACFPVYRTYIDAYRDSIDERDQAIVNASIADARRRNPAISAAIFDFVRNALLLKYPTGMDEAGVDEQRLFVMHFQQFSGPVMAKGVEDTGFYIYNPLVSLNDVGGYPQRFGASLEEFHRQNIERSRDMPHSFIATSTHDSKRGEDVRARINVLSEIPGQWRSALARWRRLNESKRGKLNGGEPVPDRNEEYLLYQTLLGNFPIGEPSDADLAEYRDRIQGYMLKALREAKVHTSWISPNAPYEEAVSQFVAALLDPSPDNRFLADFSELNSRVAAFGMYNSLSQTVLKLMSPGTPDIYQGNELFAFNLTDPDNRRPVDFELRRRLLARLKKDAAGTPDLAGFAEGLLGHAQDGQVKLYVTWRGLDYRKAHPALFAEGRYLPLTAAGPRRTHVCAFAWEKERERLVVVAPRLMASLTGTGCSPPVGEEVWGETYLRIPQWPGGQRWRNLFTGETVKPATGGKKRLLLADVLKTFPVAVLEVASPQD